MQKAQISSIEYYLPEKKLTNAELSELFPEWTAKQIEEKTGIRIRHISAEDETSADLAVKAAEKLFLKGKCSPEDIDFILFCTQSPDYFLPTSACLIQDRLGLSRSSGALDFNLGCSGFVYGLSIAQGLIETGIAQNVLLLTAETYSKFLHPKDKSVRTLFGDGAAATLIRGVDADTRLLGPFVFGSDGSGYGSLIVRDGGMRHRKSNLEQPEDFDDKSQFPGEFLYMNGPAIFSFTLKAVPDMISKIYQQTGLKHENIDLFVFHQANKFMLDALRRQANIPPERFVIDILDTGNTVSSTIPIALLDAYNQKDTDECKRALLVGFGVGLSWAAGLAILPPSL